MSYNTCRGPFYLSFSPKKKKDFCAATCCSISVASGRRISTSTVRRRLHKSGLYEGDQLCLYPTIDDKEGPAYLGQENMFSGPDSYGLLYSLQTSPYSHWRAIHDVYSSGGNEAPDIMNPTLLKDTVTEVVE